MATTFKSTTLTDRSGSTGGQLTTEMNSIANGSYSSAPGAYDNTGNNDEWGIVELNLASLNPTAGAYVQVFLAQSVDGSNYEDAPASTNPGYQMVVASIPITTGTATKRGTSPPFRLPPGKFKMYLLNRTGVSFAASANTLKLYTFNEQGV